METPNYIDSKTIEIGKGFDSSFHQLSHELRTPLNHIIGFAELLLMDKELSPTNVEYVRAILSGGERLKTAVTSHLDGAEAIAAAPPSTGDAARDPARGEAIDLRYY